jgi:hypothetical protein
MVPFYSGEYQDFTGASSHIGFYLTTQVESNSETPNNYTLGFKAGHVDETFDKYAWFIKRDISLTGNIYATLKYNHSIYHIYEIGESTYSFLLNFQGFYNSTNLFYVSLGSFYRVPVFSDKYKIPFALTGDANEFFFLVNMGYKHFTEDDSAFSFDVNNYNDFHVYNLNNVGFEFTFSSFLGDGWFYIAKLELRTSGLLVGTGMINEERFLLGLGLNFGE